MSVEIEGTEYKYGQIVRPDNKDFVEVGRLTLISYTMESMKKNMTPIVALPRKINAKPVYVVGSLGTLDDTSLFYCSLPTTLERDSNGYSIIPPRAYTLCLDSDQEQQCMIFLHPVKQEDVDA